MSILKNLLNHNGKEVVSFHMPGHKRGEAFKGTILESKIWDFDTTELTDTDCLINPTAFIKDSEEKAAKIYGAEKSFFLVNGATCGILSMFYASFKEGDKVIVCRDCHRSVVNAMVLTGVDPIYADPIIHNNGFSGGVSVDAIKSLLDKHKDVKGIFITSPTYFGIVSDVYEIAKAAHEKGALLLCDEAHGAHFPFSDKFPNGAIECGADMSVVSLHKSMPCPNQTAILNLGKCRITSEYLKNIVNIFQTTSPSYVLMAAMDYALDIGEKNGKKLTEKILNDIEKSEYIYSFDDPFKLILDFSKRGYKGYEVAEILENKFGIFPELAVESCVLLMLSWGNTVRDFSALEKAIDYIEKLPYKELKRTEYKMKCENKNVKTPRAVFSGEKEKCSLSQAEGKIAAQEVTIFPPCIPIFMPGEVIQKQHIDMINNALESNLNIAGLENGCINIVKEKN